MSYIQEPYFAVKAWELITQRDLEVIDETADFLDYTKNEILLAALCVAEVVELVARAIFSLSSFPITLSAATRLSRFGRRLSILP